MGLAKRMNLTLTIVLIVFGLTCVLVLPGLPVGRAATTLGASQKTPSGGIDSTRQAALEKLYTRLKAGDPFSEEERSILEKFRAGDKLTDLEADVVISRALFDYYITNNELTKEQQVLLGRYSQSVARRSTDIADLKRQLLNRRIAAAAAAPPRNTPLVAPANDLCSGAEVIPAAGPFPYLTAITADITDAGTAGDPPAPSCQTTVSRSIWYAFTPSATARYKVSTCVFDGTSTTVSDTVMAIYTSGGGCAGPFTEIPTGGLSDGCDDDSCGDTASLQSVITTQLIGGTQYYVVVWLFDITPPTPGNTAVQLQVSQVAPPANDNCAGATALTLDTPVNGTTVAASNDYQLSGSSCFTGVGQTASTASGVDVVYSFTAPSAANYSFRVTNYDPVLNLVLYVASTCPAGAPPVTVGNCLGASNRTFANTSEEVTCVALSSGQQVFVFVDENTLSDGSSFTIEVNACTRETEPNDTPATASTPACGIEGAISPAGDADFYSLGTPAAGSRVFALVNGAAGNSPDFDLRVTSTTDTLEYDDWDNDDAFGSAAPNVAGTPLTGASAYIRVNQFSGIAAEPYRLYAVVQPPIASATVESEPNNTTGTANSASNNYFSGSLSGPTPSSDIDIFSFTANAGDLIFLSLDCDPLRDATPINGAIALLDSAGSQLIAVNDGASTSSTSSGAGSLTSTTPNSPAEGLLWRAKTTGTYYAKVYIGTTNPVASGAGDYLLSITKNCVVAPPAPSLPGTVSFFCDFDNDGKSDIGFYRAGLWGFLKSAQSYSLGSAQFFSWGGAGLQPICADYDGDGKADIGYIVPPSGGQSATYSILQSSKAYSFLPGDVLFFPAGFPVLGDIPIVGDFDGDGKTDPGIWRASQGVWIIPKSSTNYTGFIFSQWGQDGDIPVIADFDMDGKADIGFYRNGLWGVLKSSQNYSLGSAQFFSWGGAGFQPITGDFDGDGKADIGYIVPPSGGQSAAYSILQSSKAYSFLPGDVLFFVAGFPVLGDTPAVGRFDGDAKDDPGIWRETQGVWILPLSGSGYTNYIFSQWGQSGDVPFPNTTGKH